MKKDTHPTYYPDAKVTCVCGHSFTTGSTVKEMHVEICSNCHPFYTGKQNLIDTAGTIERFKTRAAKAGGFKSKRADKKIKIEKRAS